MGPTAERGFPGQEGQVMTLSPLLDVGFAFLVSSIKYTYRSAVHIL